MASSTSGGSSGRFIGQGSDGTHFTFPPAIFVPEMN